MGDLFIVNEITHPPRFCHHQRRVEKEAEIADANARIPGSSNMPVVIRTYKGENAQEVSGLRLDVLQSPVDDILIFKAWKRDFEIRSKLKYVEY